MTDNEIIKAFKDLLNEQVDGYTDHVETGGERYEFIEKELELLKETDNLINRQKAEIERLVKGFEEVKKGIEEAKVLVAKDIAKAKAKAHKEFAERLKKELSFGKYIQADQIDNLLKEMVGDNCGV